MIREEFLNLVQINGKLISKRCTERYLSKHLGALEYINNNVPSDFTTISDKIRYVKYGGGYCKVCNTRTNTHVSGSGFAEYCSKHFHEPKKNKRAHNYKEVDLDHAIDLYLHGKAVIEVAKELGISNVALANKLRKHGFKLRSHSENQKMRAKSGYTRPRIIIDRQELVRKYVEEKTSMKYLAKIYECHAETIRRFLLQEGIIRFHRRSYIEQIIFNILKDLDVKFKVGDKKSIYPLELDFLLGNIAVEINGLYTHSQHTGKKAKKYHNNKYNLCKQKGIKLLQFWEDDINNKPDIVSSMIRNVLGKSLYRFHARKCIVKSVELNEANQFYKNNHIQGETSKNSKNIGLFFEGQLLCLLGYVQQQDHTTITRFCSSLNSNVVGGFQKLLKCVPGNKIVTYSHNDISNGDLYAQAGFECISERSYDMWYTDYQTVLNRQGFMKSKLSAKLDIFDETKTEIENMIANGYDVIWKSGTKTWQLIR